ncbi:hypothetical protein KI387_041042, partial [Taxus chinensis]
VDGGDEVSRVVISEEIGGRDVEVGIMSSDMCMGREICDNDVNVSVVIGVDVEAGVAKANADVVRVGLDVD